MVKCWLVPLGFKKSIQGAQAGTKVSILERRKGEKKRLFITGICMPRPCLLSDCTAKCLTLFTIYEKSVSYGVRKVQTQHTRKKQLTNKENPV